MEAVKNISHRLMNFVISDAHKVKISQVYVGVIYTAVKLTDGRMGVALTFPGTRGLFSHTAFVGKHPLSGKIASELLPAMLSNDPIEAAVGVATLNALLSDSAKQFTCSDTKAELLIKPGERVGMVGYLRSLAPYIENLGAQLSVFEMEPADQDDPRQLLPANAAFDILPKCSVAIITGTTLINQTLEALLDATKNCREVFIVGPSTPLCPDAFQGTSVTALSGVTIDNSQAVFDIISEGGGMRTFKNHITKRIVRVGTREEKYERKY